MKKREVGCWALWGCWLLESCNLAVGFAGLASRWLYDFPSDFNSGSVIFRGSGFSGL